MGFLNVYPSLAENVILWGAPVFFCAFLLCVFTFKLASGENCSARLNKINLLFFFPYALGSLLFCAVTGRLRFSLLPCFAAGSFIYFSLHYIYLMAFINLAKKSVSVNILSDIRDLGAGGQSGSVTMAALLAHEKEKIEYVRQTRLDQMVVLGMAERRQAEYRITRLGRFLNRLGNTILKIWNLRRL